MRTNTTEVKNKIKEHIREHYENLQDMKNDTKSFDYLNTDDYHKIEKLVEGGCFLCYHNDVKNFLDSLGINPSGKEYTNEKSWTLYTHLIALNGSGLIAKLTK